MSWKKASPYPAVCSRPPWAPGWCLHCGAPGWKALPHLPLLSGSVRGRTLSTLFGGEREREREEGVRPKKKRVMICITICKNPHYIRPSRTGTGFCSGSALVSCSWHFFLFGSIEVVVLWCAYSYSKITLHHSFRFDATRGALQRDPSGSFSHCLVCRTQLHMQGSQSESVGSFTDRLLFT